MTIVIDGTTGISGVDGTASNPSYEGTDSNTGIFYPAADQVAIGTGGTEALRVNSSQNVGIGTTSPASKLHISGGTINTARIDGSTGGGAWAVMRNGSITGGIYNTGAVLGDTTSGVGIFAETGLDVRFYTNGSATERARITSDGYSKFSNNGTYVGSTNSWHEFRQTAESPSLIISSTNANLGTRTVQVEATRSATSAYSLYAGYSGAGADLEFMLYGDGNGKCDGSWTGGGADYAEYFESATGAALTLGATVVLDGNKVREATDQDPASAIMGVVRPKEPSKASAVIGNAAWNKWSKKYLTDDFDRYIMEDHDVVEWTDEDGKEHSYESHNIPAGVTVPDDAVVKTHDEKGNKFQHYKLNPAWNPDVEYINRENRHEWIIVGLVGQVKVLKGQPVNDRWIKMRDVSATVEEWMIR
jgi:hypothetical protein